MTASKEDILLSIPHVKNKKCDGSLCLLSERIAWMPTGKSTLTISQFYTEIKAQKISPESKDKVQLQIILVASGAHTFHFNNPDGREAQLKDRDSVKDLLQQMLNKYKKQMNNDLEEKNRMLQDDPHLFQLYKSLVVGGILTADEFWNNRMNRPKVGEISRQEIGASSGFFIDVRQPGEGGTSKYKLTTEIMLDIFKTYPTVKRKHQEYVPDVMDDKTFWEEFLKSHYFLLDKMAANEQAFAGCQEEDERRLKREVVPLIKSKNALIQTLADLNPDKGLASSEFVKSESSIAENAFLIKQLNQHSTLVLKSTNHTVDVDDPRATSSSSSEQNPEDRGIKRKIVDLHNIDDTVTGKPLKLSRTDAYKHGPLPEVADAYNTTLELMEAARVFTHDVMAWKPTPSNQLLSGSAGISVIWELSPSGTLMQDSSGQQFNDLLPKELLQELKSMYSGLGELVRHFWSCFPVTSKELEDKLIRMEECLRKFQNTKIPAFTDKLDSYRLAVDPTSHMNTILEKVFTKYTNWSDKKNRRN